MRGSIVRRKDRFYVVTDVPPGPDGKRKQKWHAGYPTRREAEQQLRRVLCELDAGRCVAPSDRTLEAYLLEDWLPAMATTVRPATLRIYRQAITAYVLPALGHRRLADLDPLLLAKHYAKLLTTPMQRRSGTLSPRTVRYVHVVLEHALADAVLWRLLAHNPAEGARPPSASASRPAARVHRPLTWPVVSGGAHWGAGLFVPARDLAAIGQLFLDDGTAAAGSEHRL